MRTDAPTCALVDAAALALAKLVDVRANGVVRVLGIDVAECLRNVARSPTEERNRPLICEFGRQLALDP